MSSRDDAFEGNCEVPVPTPPRLFIHPPGDPHRLEVEAFIHRIYAERYGADVRQFAPVLASLRDDSGIVAAAGYRSASQGPLFLERYFDAPVESLLAGHAATTPSRERIVEVGHLAAARAGEGRRLIRLLGTHLASLRFDWVVSTLTAELRHLFLRIGVAPLALGVADPAALGAELSHWGSYYDHRPVVLAGHLPQALQQLARRQAVSERRS
ncbi:MAG: thermostable hemolysin [Pseudomonadota bacterium]|nr:thermostable hemolysin [Pseudomonadota bacterium]